MAINLSLQLSEASNGQLVDSMIVPEPATIGSLALAALVLLARRYLASSAMG